MPRFATGRTRWCLRYSEPGAGSDLAGLRTRADRDGDRWIVNGQKVWTSFAKTADYGMLVARTDWDVSKHNGISFNEVFLSDAVVSANNMLGDLNLRHGPARDFGRLGDRRGVRRAR
jgi:hypothetical protein